MMPLRPPLSTTAELAPPSNQANPLEVIQDSNRGSIEPVQSNEFAATLVKAGVRGKFRELQALLIDITRALPDIHAYAKGTMFRDLISEFEAESEQAIFDNQTLFGKLSISVSQSVVASTRAGLRRVNAVMQTIKSSLVIANDIYDRVDRQVSGSNSEYLSVDVRTESLLVWAYRSGAKLNADISGKSKLGTATRQTRVVTDLFGLLDLLDSIILDLETLLILPAYYRTATSSDTSQIETPVKVVYVQKGESLEALAFRELGNADKAALIMEFNDLSPSDIYAEADEYGNGGWDGRSLNLPYTEIAGQERLRNNFVLDSQTGIAAMGRDIANDMQAENGDLVLLNYTDNLFQSLDNIIQTHAGSIPEEPEYGNRALQIENGGIPQIVGHMVAAELHRALMTNPRVESVENVKAVKDGAAFRVKYQITSVNKLTESQLTAQLDTT